MKPGITPVLSSSWWTANKGKTVPANPLEGALKAYEAAKAAFEKTIEQPNADGYAAYTAAKNKLAADVVKAVDAEIAACIKIMHKDAIAGLNKYKSTIIPAEKAELDKTFLEFKSRHEGVLESMLDAMESFIAALSPIAELSAKTVLACQAKAPEADKALGAVTTCMGKGDAKGAGVAATTATEVGAFVAAQHKALQDAIKKAPKTWPLDRAKLAEKDKTAANKLGDRKSTLESQIEANMARVEEIKKEVESVMSQARQLTKGTLDTQNALVGSFNRLINRAFALAQSNDVPAREMKAALSNLDGDIIAYGKAADPKEKDKHKTLAKKNLDFAKVQCKALEAALKNGKAEISTLQKSMPANVVKRDNPVFTPLFVELDKALKSFTEDDATLLKESGKLKNLEAKFNTLK